MIVEFRLAGIEIFVRTFISTRRTASSEDTLNLFKRYLVFRRAAFSVIGIIV